MLPRACRADPYTSTLQLVSPVNRDLLIDLLSAQQLEHIPCPTVAARAAVI